MKTYIIKSLSVVAVICLLGFPAISAPLVTSFTTANIEGSGYDAVDFYFESGPGAEFTNYRLDFHTGNRDEIYDPIASRQDVASDAIDTFMNTPGSYLGLGDAVGTFYKYTPSGNDAAPTFINRLDWGVWDSLTGDTNSFHGNTAPYHLARILVKPGAKWLAGVKAFDTDAPGANNIFIFSTDPSYASYTLPSPPRPADFIPQVPLSPDPPSPVEPAPVVPPAMPMVTTSTVLDIGGSGLNAIDFYYSSSPGAEFTNYRLDFGTTNGALIHDPLPGERQSAGGQAVDTFMNTVGSFLGVENATHLTEFYRPPGASSGPVSTDRIGWDVFDLLEDDTNSFNGNTSPYHMARVLVTPDAMWNATFTAYDTATPGVGTAHNFTNDPTWTFPQPVTPPPVNPLPPQPTLPDPPTPPVVDPGPVTPPIIITPISPPTPPQPTPKPVVTTTTILNVGDTGLNAIDFYYSSSPGAEFTNFNLNFRTEDGAGIYDPVPADRQDAGGDAVDTFMNTVGSLLDLGNATHLYGDYDPLSANGTDPVSKIEWDVFDTLPGDTNNMDGAGVAPYHLARILVSPNARWNATFTAFDTNNAGIPTALDFTNDPNGFTPEFVPVPIVPEPVVPEPGIPDPVDPPPLPIVPVPPELPPIIEVPVIDPPSDEDSGWTPPDTGLEEPATEFPILVPVEFPVAIDIPRGGLREWIDFPAEGGIRFQPFQWIAFIDPTDADGAPQFADDMFLVPAVLPIAEGKMLQTFTDGQRTTTTAGTTARLVTLNGQQYYAFDGGVPEPSGALLASLAVALFAAARHGRRR